MRTFITTFLTLIFTINAFSQNADTATAHKFITDYYEKNNYANYDTSGCKYSGFEIKKLETPYLNKYFLGWTVFRTEFFFDYTNYPKVPAIIVYNEAKPEGSFVMYASTFKKPRAPFFKVFNGIKVPDLEQRKLLSLEIADLFAIIHTEANVKELVCNKYQITDAYELWQNGSSLRLINVHYTKENKLLYIDMINGTAGGDVRNGYIRKE